VLARSKHDHLLVFVSRKNVELFMMNSGRWGRGIEFWVSSRFSATAAAQYNRWYDLALPKPNPHHPHTHTHTHAAHCARHISGLCLAPSILTLSAISSVPILAESVRGFDDRVDAGSAVMQHQAHNHRTHPPTLEHATHVRWERGGAPLVGGWVDVRMRSGRRGWRRWDHWFESERFFFSSNNTYVIKADRARGVRALVIMLTAFDRVVPRDPRLRAAGHCTWLALSQG
jgi:hypothetical protein